MTKYVEIAWSLANYYKVVDCYSCKHGNTTANMNRKFPLCLKGCQSTCMKNNYSEWEFKAQWWEKVVRIYEEED